MVDSYNQLFKKINTITILFVYFILNVTIK